MSRSNISPGDVASLLLRLRARANAVAVDAVGRCKASRQDWRQLAAVRNVGEESNAGAEGARLTQVRYPSEVVARLVLWVLGCKVGFEGR